MISDRPATEWLIRCLNHPLMLTIGIAISFVLWMPYGMGYYGFPWQNRVAVWALLAFVIAYPVSALFGLIRACRPRFFMLDFAVATISLIVGLHGLFHMLHWWAYMASLQFVR